MLTGNTVAVAIAFIGILCYVLKSYFPYPPVVVIGIDLGTSFSGAAYFNNGFGNVSIIYDQRNKPIFPSTVTFYENGSIVVGEYPGFSDISRHVTFYDSKRYIGRRNLTVHNLLSYPFKLDIVDGQVKFVLPEGFKVKTSTSSFTPVDLAFLIILHVKENFKKRFGYYPEKAVIGVPVEFDELQRNETIKAAKLAGLNVLRLVNEPTAASMACDVHNRPSVENVVVLDLGGGTYDVAILNSVERTLNTLSIAGNDRLGGRDFTSQFANCIQEMTESGPGFQGREHEEFFRVVEEAKIQLSRFDTVEISFEKNHRNWLLKVTRDQFNECTDGLFRKLIKPIQLALEEAHLTVKDIHEIVLVGGATRMPKFRIIVRDFFNREPNNDVDPDTAVLIGLANQAGILTQGWPLEKSAIDIPPKFIRKINVA
ncbi:Heat shock 70 kDa protein 13 [Thelohanellus kitauei]|uniref:Heat shock 70 kDa protein 13 n=1 Tax=Thelohanellus kitauei TaxID=669202 RepID=A0A0C2MYH6_THEKT|nr:Heat shock 70 kDa protein 13 [Thelohanellus kitauei]